MIAAALALLLYNHRESAYAGDTAAEHLLAAQSIIEVRKQAHAETVTTPKPAGSQIAGAPSDAAQPPEVEEPTPIVEIDGIGYMGFLTIPAINLEMPVTAQWSEANLKIAACRHYGSFEENCIVVAGHNYTRVFGRLKRLKSGDAVYFTDMNGIVHGYTVKEVEILNADDIDKMLDSRWNLSLYTCTYNGKQRVTVRCVEKNEEN